ncbi:MAG: glycosyltransferase family 1 protein [Ignavibacteriae bacterium]|nr:glycosyltransferase family 1 protein [Ignavibacteriota bacterium]
MRVAHFAGTMRPGHDGVTRVLYRMTTALAGAGVDHVFVSPIVPPESERTAPMIEVPSVAFPLYTDYRLATPGSRYFGKQVLDFRPDILHIHSPCSLGYAAVRFGKKHNIPVVATYHTHFASYAKYYNIPMLEPFGWSYLRHLYDGCDRIFVPSMPILDELWSQGFRRLQHLPHGVDATVFHPGARSFSWRTAHGIPGNKKMLLFAGRLVWEKDLRTLAAAYAQLTRERQDIVFVLAGDGPVRHELEALMPDAIFLGQLNGTDLSHAYASADLFVFPSTTETFGNVIIEAMASGTVPICAREGGAAGVVQHGVTGLLTHPRDPADIRRAVAELLDAPARRESMALQALEFARRQSWQNIFQNMIESYRDVRNEHQARKTHRHRKAA